MTLQLSCRAVAHEYRSRVHEHWWSEHLLRERLLSEQLLNEQLLSAYPPLSAAWCPCRCWMRRRRQWSACSLLSSASCPCRCWMPRRRQWSAYLLLSSAWCQCRTSRKSRQRHWHESDLFQLAVRAYRASCLTCSRLQLVPRWTQLDHVGRVHHHDRVRCWHGSQLRCFHY